MILTLLIADEPTTALDVTIQAQILQVMKDMQEKLGTSIILITHDLGIVADMCDKVIVMYAGQVVERGNKFDIFKSPQHPYTQGLLKSLPRMDQGKDELLIPIEGTPPDMANPPQGCAFAARCPHAMEVCVSRILTCSHTARPMNPSAGFTPSRSKGGGRHMSSNNQAMLDVDQLSKFFDVGKGKTEGSQRTQLVHPQGRDAWRGRRVRLRQVHGRPHDHAPL